MMRVAARWAARGARGWRRRALLLAAGLLLLVALRLRTRSEVRLTELFPSLAPVALAHFLADFSNHAGMYPQLESWTIEEEWSNYTSWSYEVSYRCGARCGGRVSLSAHAPHRPAAALAAADTHRLLARDTRCTEMLLLPWPLLCEEKETETLIEGEKSGARLQEITRGSCGALTALFASCAGDDELRAARRQHMRALRVALAQDDASARR
ncbi:uncharacterized protein [Epargyreus clarus]|uniref:uncharacterized protein n=1 Tax=Epargyreus clarus TaxID=520877 RepID=UPI003C2F0289